LHGYKPIRSILHDLLFKHKFADEAGYKKWLKVTPSGGGSSLMAPLYTIRWKVIDTVCFVGLFFRCAVTNTLRTMWAQWQIAYSCGIRSQSEETALHIIGSLMDSSQHVLFVKDIIHWCCESFKDQSLPKMSQCANRKQPEYDCLLYAKLMSMTRSASNAEKALKTLVKKFGKVNFNEDDEQIFPLLHLFCDTVMSAPFVHQERYFDAYRALQPVYLWPLPHCDVARDVMNFIQDEMRSPGFTG
jgi:hypothetical protein